MREQLAWRDGLPYSTKFQDVYFSSDNGLLETEYVFLQGNDLPTRWQQTDLNHFTIIETGFGTGLNFLCAARLWLASAPKHAVLHFVSVEKYPLELSDISTALALWPELTDLSTPLIHQYETLMNTKANTSSISLYNHRVQLSVYTGDATEQLACISNIADAWFLDGFAPAKNPEMWHSGLFSEMAKHAHPSTTFATFTSAGDVRRGLINAGFKVNKRAGFGKKREMLCGEFIGTQHD
ncbi:tRNA (5-methylaminomethyl-2-thiouridine)(34)-methyltransferase MnmD [Methylotenera sp. L2L1]|uniref:tRNA (5-methylaminomethyl-2-thiouridine)(34)-methyltransferase MnmD n=1 Tax=Methylotenera sp. L2L1 TaxID=1502770 RepID=UPI000A81D0D4|nr:tRNA (5-methylaminomethyl-2-thiouridine)(34)-methyltransferase MnmD [Methylotenera sp. L2L1]